MPHNQPLVSVIVPAFNAEDHIEFAISSVLSQTYQSFELLIVNDGSQDNTEDVIESFQDKNLLIMPAENSDLPELVGAVANNLDQYKG